MQPKISVIMPVYNAESRIDISINSVLNQSYKNFEFILIDDGSLDKSGEICNEYAKADNRIKVIHQKNSGVSAARNRGIKEAQGDYINFIDADDTIEVGTFETLINHIKENDSDMIIYGMSFDYYKKGKYLNSSYKVIKEDMAINEESLKDYFFMLYDSNYLSSSCNKLIKKSIIQENKILFNTNMAILEDFKFTLDILDYAKDVFAIKEPFYKYYNEKSSSSFSRRPNINYMKNFNILDNRVRKTASNIGLDRNLCSGRINGMILRYYLIYLEMLFSGNAPIQHKYKELKEFMLNKEVKCATNKAKCSGKSLKIIHYLLKYRWKIALFSLFYFNNIYKNRRRKI